MVSFLFLAWWFLQLLVMTLPFSLFWYRYVLVDEWQNHGVRAILIFLNFGRAFLILLARLLGRSSPGAQPPVTVFSISVPIWILQ